MAAGRARRARASPSRGGASRSGSWTTSRGSRSTSTTRSRRSRTTSSARSSTGSARTARSARTRTRSDHRRAHGRPRPGLLRLRLEEVRLDHRLAPPLRAAPDRLLVPRHERRLRRLPPVRPPREDRRARRRRRGRDVPPQRTLRADEVWEHLPAEVQEQIVAKRLRLFVVDATRVAQEAGIGPPRQHRPADVLLRARRRAAARRGDRSRSRRRSGARTASAARRCSSATRPRSTRALDGLREVAVPAVAAALATAVPRPCRQRRSTSSPARHGDDARGPRRHPPGQRPSGRRDVPDRHHPPREALDRGRDPDLGSVDLHRLRQVRDRLPARGDPDEGVPARGARRALPRASSSKDWRDRAPARDADDDPGRARRLHRLRDLRRHVPGPRQGGGRAPLDQPRAEARPSRRRARAVRLLPLDPGDRPDARRAGHREGLADARSRCSSSPAPARAAARRRT